MLVSVVAVVVMIQNWWHYQKAAMMRVRPKSVDQMVMTTTMMTINYDIIQCPVFIDNIVFNEI